MKTKANLIDFAGHPLGEPVVPTDVTGQAITATLPDGIKKFTLQVDTDIAGGAITINGTALKTPAGDDVTSLSSTVMFYDIVAGDTNFILPPKGNTTWAAEYDGVNAEVLDTLGNQITVNVGDYIYTEPSSLQIIGSGGTVVDVNAEVVAQNYSTIGNGGRKIVTLDDGTIIVGLKVSSTEYALYKSLDNGSTWVLDYTSPALATVLTDIALATDGTKVHVLLTYSNQNARVDTFILDGTRESFGVIDTGQTAMGNCSLVIAPNGDLHATWASKNASYPNSFNIRYSVSTDGGANWSSVTQVTTETSTSRDYNSPSIVMGGDNYPKIVVAKLGSSGKYIITLNFNGSSWTPITVYASTGYEQVNPCYDKLSDGTLIVAWQGQNVTYSSAYSIYFSQSSDNGATWSTPVVVAQADGTPTNYREPSITRTSNDEIHILVIQANPSDYDLIDFISEDGVTWNGNNIETALSTTSYPSTAIDFRDFVSPLVVYQKNATNVVFDGEWSTAPTITFPPASSAATGDDIRATFSGVLKFKGQANGDRVTGFKSTTNLID